MTPIRIRIRWSIQYGYMTPVTYRGNVATGSRWEGQQFVGFPGGLPCAPGLPPHLRFPYLSKATGWQGKRWWVARGRTTACQQVAHLRQRSPLPCVLPRRAAAARLAELGDHQPDLLRQHHLHHHATHTDTVVCEDACSRRCSYWAFAGLCEGRLIAVTTPRSRIEREVRGEKDRVDRN